MTDFFDKLSENSENNRGILKYKYNYIIITSSISYNNIKVQDYKIRINFYKILFLAN